MNGPFLSDPFYCWEVFLRASHALATGKGEIKERLAKAAREISVLHPQQLPEQLRAEYEKLMVALDLRTVATMRKDKAVVLAERIVDLESTLREICYEESLRD